MKSKIYSIIIEFDVLQGMEQEFEHSWAKTTEYIKSEFSSLGSRLHKTDNEKYIAIALWPSKQAYEQDQTWSDIGLKNRTQMHATLKYGTPKVLYKLETIADYWL